MRDWVTNVERTHYLLGTVAGPHPFPVMVRDFQRSHRRRGARPGAASSPAAARRRRRLRRRRVQRDRHLPRVHRRRRRAAVRLRGRRRRHRDRPARRDASPVARPASCTARGRYVLQDEMGQTIESHSISAGLDYPGVGPEHAWLHDTGRASTRRSPTPRRWRPSRLLCRTEGIIPAIESAHALAGALEVGRRARARTRSSWSTCPAAATRTWTPRRAGSGWCDRCE